VAEARGEIVAFLDDDVIVDANWLLRLRECFDQTDADVVGGRSYLITAKKPPNWLGPAFRRQLAEVNLGNVRKTLGPGEEVYGLNLAFRKAVLQEYGGFQENIGRLGNNLLCGEETVLIARISNGGGKVYYEPAALVGHLIAPERLTWQYMRRCNLGTGVSYARCEPPGSLLLRCRRVFLGLGNVCLRALQLLCKSICGCSAYERYRAAMPLWRKIGVLIQRWRYLCGTK